MERIDVRKLTSDRTEFRWEETADALGLGKEKAFRSPIKVAVGARKIGDRVLVDGSVETGVALECSRCLGEFELPLRAAVSLEYREGPAPDEKEGGPDEGETESDIGHYTPPHVEVGEDLRQMLLLEIPPYPVCDGNCLGLCPSCGANLNAGPCGCGKAPARR